MSIKTQKEEFAAVEELDKHRRRLMVTPPVDDDFPEVRHDYECARIALVAAMKENGTPKPSGDWQQNEASWRDAMRVNGLVLTELQGAMGNWPAFNSAHEGYAVLLEELDELWQHVKTNQLRRDLMGMRKEAIQVAAMAIRFAVEVCGEESGRK